jgi:hypothetical protein
MPRERSKVPDDPMQNGPPLVIVEGDESTTLESPLRVPDDEESTVNESPRLGEDDDTESTEVSLPQKR